MTSQNPEQHAYDHLASAWNSIMDARQFAPREVSHLLIPLLLPLEEAIAELMRQAPHVMGSVFFFRHGVPKVNPDDLPS